MKKNIAKDKNLLELINIDSFYANQLIKTTKRQFDNNSSGIIFNEILNGIIYTSLINGDEFELQSVQKRSEIFYTKYTRKYELNPQNVFETGEIFFAEKKDHIYIIAVKILDIKPLIEPNLAADINQLLFSIKFL